MNVKFLKPAIMSRKRVKIDRSINQVIEIPTDKKSSRVLVYLALSNRGKDQSWLAVGVATTASARCGSRYHWLDFGTPTPTLRASSIDRKGGSAARRWFFRERDFNEIFVYSMYSFSFVAWEARTQEFWILN